ncbi:hypothetical protein [Acuticoccus sediminis]|uniref:hypothetical protein n=1 Tax=Acuticoccus sediminis TaxID=2184697 RepID=UPI001CFC755B|nr:hypothetical protein [Acuticoccus sediminis]
MNKLWALVEQGSDASRRTASDLLVAALLQMPGRVTPRNLNVVIRAALCSGNTDARQLIARVALLDDDEKRTLAALTDLCGAVREQAGEAPAPKEWTISARSADDGYLLREQKVAIVNLTPLHLDSVTGIDRDRARYVLDSLQISLGSPKFVNDGCASALPHLGGRDRLWLAKLLMLVADTASDPRKQILVSQRRAQRHLGEPDYSGRAPWVRVGPTELGALWSYHNDRVGALEAAVRVAEDAERLKLTDAPTIHIDEPGWPRLDAYNNILRLSRNAGWYSTPSLAREAFADWAQRYTDAIRRGRIFDAFLPHLATMAPFIDELAGNVSASWTDRSFIRRLDGARVVLVSVYADVIQSNFASGGLHRLWEDAEVPFRLQHVETVRAPVSVFPNMPRESWSQSFQDVLEQSREAVRRSEADLFIASCGCYGLPLIEAVAREDGVASLCMGHHINTFFGVQSKSSENTSLYKSAPNSPHWVHPDLSQIKGLGSIDGGRYAARNGSRDDSPTG